MNPKSQMAVVYEEQIVRISQKIRELRRMKGLTVQELAYRCDMERSNLSRLETGRSNPTLRTLCALCQALDVSLAELLRG